MSTKTSIKRIALVVVSALGFGLVAAVPSNAAPGTATAISVANSTTVNAVALASNKYTSNPVRDDLQISAFSVPAGSTVGLQVTAVGGTFTTGDKIQVGMRGYGYVVALAALPATTSGNEAIIGTFVAPSVAGTYTLDLTLAKDGTLNAATDLTTSVTMVVSGNELGSTIASASDAEVTSISLTASAPSSRVGSKVTINPSFVITNNTGGTIDTKTYKATLAYILTAPAATALSASSEVRYGNNAALTNGSTETRSTTAVTFTPAVAGSYTLTAFHDADLNGVFTVGEASKSVTIAVSADAPALAIKAYGSTTSTTAGAKALVKVTLTNGGAAASLGVTESFTVTVNGSATTSKTVLTQADFDAYGQATFTVADATPETVTVTVTGSGSTAIAALLQTVSIKFVATSNLLDSSYTAKVPTAAAEYTTTANTVADTSVLFYDYAKNPTVTITGTDAGAAPDKVKRYTVTDTLGCFTGVPAAVYDVATTTGTAGAYSISQGASFTTGDCALSLAAVSKTNAVTFATIAVDEATDDTFTLKAALSLVTDVTVYPATQFALNGSTINYIVVARDQFYVAKPGVALLVTMDAGSRNSGKFLGANLITDVNGSATWSYTDAPLTANSSLTVDNFTVVSSNVAANSGIQANSGGVVNSGASKVTFASSFNVSKVTVTGGDTTAGVTSVTKTPVDIKAQDGVEAGGVTFSAKVTDVNGASLAGVPVTWSITGAANGAAIKSTFVLTYTGNDGVASATSAVYGWLAGTYTVTATAGGVSGTGEITFANVTNVNEERSISSSVSGSTVTAKVVDRFGNPVKGVMVYATKTGIGYFGTGVSKIKDTTGADGTVTFNIAGGDAVVTVSTIDYDGAPGTKGSGQTCARAGAADCQDDSANDTPFTAYVAGTLLKAEVGVGASFSAAGVATAPAVTVTGAVSPAVAAAEAASDAALEAIDAANAATDAANLAAEAADAATVAAEEARDAADAATAAVEELATQVATLMAALKAQITTLANTVAKIARKVKA